MWAQNGGFITHRVFGGRNKALTYISIASALSMTGKLPVVLLDEMGVIDPPSRQKVLCRLREAVEREMISQAIVIHNEPLVADGWSNVAL